MTTYKERLSELKKRPERLAGPIPMGKELWKRRFETDPSLIRSVGYAGEAAQERPEAETPLLTNISERVSKGRPTFFIGETPEEVATAKKVGAEKAILGRPRPKIAFDKFGEPIIEKEIVAPERAIMPRGTLPSKEDVDLNQKWMDFRENYFIPQIGYDPRKINPVQEKIDTENGIMSQIDINSLDVNQYTKLKKEAEKRGKLAEELANEKIKIGKDKETQAFELFKTDMASRQKEIRRMSFKDVNDYLYRMTHDSAGNVLELEPADLMQLQEMAKQSGYEIVTGTAEAGKEKSFWWDKEEKKGYFVRPMGETGVIPQRVGGQLDIETAQNILKEAGGDKNRARQIARDRGYKF